jgi:hypothetical protein
VCGSRAWARSRLGCVTPETATYASLWRAFLENQSQPQNLLSESLYLLRDKKLIISSNKTIILKKPTFAQQEQRLTEQANKFLILFSYFYIII